MNKSLYALVFAILSVYCLLSGCTAGSMLINGPNHATASNGDDSPGEVNLSVYMYVTDVRVQNVYYEIAHAFEAKHPHIKVDLKFPGFQYEEILKVKLAASELPDIFDTHGWAKVRYGKYLLDLRNEPWAGRLSDTIKQVVTDEEGKVYVLPLSEARDGFSYNISVLDKYHIQVPTTFDELMAAADTIKNKSGGEVVPFFFSGIDSWTIGQYFDYSANSLFQQLDGTIRNPLTTPDFDWNSWNSIAAKWKEMFEKGYTNEDVFSAEYSDLPKLFAEDKVAFSFASPSFSDDTYEINPKTRIGIMPVPSITKGSSPTFSGGERNTMGIWNKSKHLTEARLLINDFAEADNMKKIADVVKIPPGLKGITPEHEFVPFYNQYEHVKVIPYYDRIYLPSGMWDVMRSLGIDLIAGQMAPNQFGQRMKQEAERLSR